MFNALQCFRAKGVCIKDLLSQTAETLFDVLMQQVLDPYMFDAVGFSQKRF